MAALRWGILYAPFIAALALACSPSHQEIGKVHPAIPLSRLDQQLESEISTIQRDPLDAIGIGEKSYHPYDVRVGWGLVRSREPETTARLLGEARRPDQPLAARLAMIHVLALREDPLVDAALIDALGEPALLGTAAYSLGRIGFKGYPQRPRDIAGILAALEDHLEASGAFLDPWHELQLPNQDLVLGAFVRLAGVDHFRLPEDGHLDFIGYDLPSFSPAERSDLLAQCREYLLAHPESRDGGPMSSSPRP